MIAVAGLAAAAGLINALGSLAGRRAALAAVPPATLALAFALGSALAVAPWWLAPQARLLPDPWWLAPAAGALLAAGNILLAGALGAGSAALAVPVLSGKVVLVALGAALLGGQLQPSGIIAAALACAGIVLLAAGPVRGRVGATVALAAASALAYAGFDLLFAHHGARLGLAGMLPAATAWGVVCSLPLLARVRCPAGGRVALAAGAAFNGVQTTALVAAIILAGDATLPNVLYGCRGLWSVLLAAAAAAWLGHAEDGGSGLDRRLAGAGLLAAAIAITLLGG